MFIFAGMLFFVAALSACHAKAKSSSKKQSVEAKTAKQTAREISKLGEDASYYNGLLALKNGDKAKAESLFLEAIKSGSRYCAQNSYEQYIGLAEGNEKIKRAVSFLESSKSEAAQIAAAVALCDEGAYAEVVKYITSVDYATCNDDLAFARVKSLRETGDPKYSDELVAWFASRPVTLTQYKFFQEISVGDNQDKTIPPSVAIHMAVYRRDYSFGASLFKKEAKNIPHSPQVFSDGGKALLYSGASYKDSAKFLASFLSSASKENAGQKDASANDYYIYFYCARLFSKAQDAKSSAENYKNALNMAGQAHLSKEFDNTLWYFIDMNLKSSPEDAIKIIDEYASKWQDPTYFSDIFNLMLPLLITQRKYDVIYNLYKDTKGFASKESTARYAYVYARLVQENIVNFSGSPDQKLAFLIDLFSTACDGGVDYYYKAMALYHLNKIHEKYKKSAEQNRVASLKSLKKIKSATFDVLCSTNVNPKMVVDTEASAYLSGYAIAGLPEYIYKEYMEFYEKGIAIDTDTGLLLCTALTDAAMTNFDYYPQSLRIAVRVTKQTTRPLTKKDFFSLFPKDYRETVEQYCQQYDIPPANMFALMRSESFFDHDVISSATAKGLCQLMDKTASDIAKKLKISDFDLTVPDTNIHFGCFYVAEINRRLDGLWLSTFFAYNAGFSRVKRWLRDTKKMFPNMTSLKIQNTASSDPNSANDAIVPEDIMLEIIPYEETREYGRKLVGATAMYSYIYENRSIEEIIEGLNIPRGEL